MKNFLLVVLLTCAPAANAGQAQKWLKSIEGSHDLAPGNVKQKYLHFDFSDLIKPKHEFLGYVGAGYQRLNISFSSATKNAAHPELYLIEGTAASGPDTCRFSGTIKIDRMREYAKMHFGVDDAYKDKGVQAQGVIIGNYDLRESGCENSGIFTGVMTSSWYLDKDGAVRYDDIGKDSDSYSNNQYVGVWKSAGKKLTRTANWGEFRIPFSGDLDIGSGDFGANPKYKDRGW
jgi:hypothetical protein